MIHLAQVQKQQNSKGIEIQLLAQQKAENVWEINRSENIFYPGEYQFTQGNLVLVEISPNNQIVNIREAKDWLINLIATYLNGSTITPEFVKLEQERIERWRQELTAKSLDLKRQYLELETRREELQKLEMDLQRQASDLEQARNNNA